MLNTVNLLLQMCSVGHTHQLFSFRGVLFMWCVRYDTYTLVVYVRLPWLLPPRRVTYVRRIGDARGALAQSGVYSWIPGIRNILDIIDLTRCVVLLWMRGCRLCAREAVRLTCDSYKVDCEPVSADLTQWVLESGVWRLRPPLHKGIPTLAGYYGVTVTVTVGKTEIVV